MDTTRGAGAREDALARDNDRLRAVLQRIADRRPSATGEAAAFRQVQEDARAALREPWGRPAATTPLSAAGVAAALAWAADHAEGIASGWRDDEHCELFGPLTPEMEREAAQLEGYAATLRHLATFEVR